MKDEELQAIIDKWCCGELLILARAIEAETVDRCARVAQDRAMYWALQGGEQDAKRFDEGMTIAAAIRGLK